MGEGFAERRETSVESFFADVFDRNIDQFEAVEVVYSGKVFSRIPWEFSHWVPLPEAPSAPILQRTDIFEEVGFGSREGDTVHPSLIISVVYRDRREETSLAGSHPPSIHQSTCDQRLSAFSVYEKTRAVHGDIHAVSGVIPNLYGYVL